MMLKRFLPIIVLLIAMLSAYFSGITKIISKEHIKEINDLSQAYVKEHMILAPLIFIGIYFVYTSLAIPGGFVLTVLAGCLFPFPISTLYVLIADTGGSCMLFLSARAAFGNDLYAKATPFLGKMEKGFQQNAVGYMLLLRFIPIVPFWLINVAPAFFKIRFTTFLWTTVVGLIPENLFLTFTASSLMKLLP